MKIALIGYGKMGRAIEQIALERGHTIVAKIDINNPDDFDSPEFASADVAIEFTTPSTAHKNVVRAWQAGVKVVCGTTGWDACCDELKAEAKRLNATFMWSSNFSVGVNLFFQINRRLAELMNRYPSYNIAVHEVHHIHKKDAPSGTAVTIADDICSRIDRFNGWSNEPQPEKLLVTSERVGEVPGIHQITYSGTADTITLRHEAHSRQGFALGAVIAAEYTAVHSGWLNIDDIYNN